MANEAVLMPHLRDFKQKIDTDTTYVDRTGVKFVEIIGSTMVLNPAQKTFDFGIKKTNEEYCEKEMKWYESMDLHIDMVRDVKIWRDVAAQDGTINSNYGWCIYSADNYRQFDHALTELINNPDSRRAIMIYTRPSMWNDYNHNGRNDFMCTNYHHFMIRNKTLISIYNIRSNDLVFGFFNDYYWAATIHQKMFNALYGPLHGEIEMGYLMWQASSLHVYERHWPLIDSMVNGGKR